VYTQGLIAERDPTLIRFADARGRRDRELCHTGWPKDECTALRVSPPLARILSPAGSLVGAFVLDDVSASVNTVLHEDPSPGIARQ